jgi:hypothetical protein
MRAKKIVYKKYTHQNIHIKILRFKNRVIVQR